ncbi:DUF58 domain-containing protein [Shewanella sp. NIFS-20-20]|uniref:DUF58 domain-containing protein n=1 Tax=Shewanella sp. NIFS-20-20 TaxID=2853806 RepID=UPI001C460AC3|nr:DUF58 domain-containing protein [Shewanella sp. NIFS-20-20]MBV7315006.1 DUF58 domain-containing protein [Shewanella sp. NIFS-20-20]
MKLPASMPLFADGISLTDKELLACQRQAIAVVEHRGRARAALAGHRSSAIKGRGMEFAEVRHYQQGDDVRTIDWRVTARTGKVHTKLFVEERERPVIILLDLSYSLYFGSSLLLQSVQAAHLAATLGWAAIRHGDRLGGLIVTESQHQELKPRSRQAGILPFINAITKLHGEQLHQLTRALAEPDYLAHACQRLVRLAKPGSLIYLISDGFNFSPACRAPLSMVSRHCDISAFVITDPLRQGQTQLPRQFQLPVREGNVERWLDRTQYEAWLLRQQQQQQQFVSMLQGLTIQPRFIDAGQPLNQQLDKLG